MISGVKILLGMLKDMVWQEAAHDILDIRERCIHIRV